MTVIRVGLGLPEHVFKRLSLVTKSLGVPQSRLLSAVVSVLTEKEIGAILERYTRLEHIETELRSTADANMLSYIRGRPLSDLESMLNAAKKAGRP